MPSQSLLRREDGPPAAAEIRRARPLLGTLVDICVERAVHSDSRLNQLLDLAFERVARIHSLMSFHEPDSDLTQLNRFALEREVEVQPDTFCVLETALDIARRSGGAFDPCVGAQLQQFGMLPSNPADGARGLTASYRHVVLKAGRRVRFLQPLCLDLGGIAKGYAVDVAVEGLQQACIKNLVVNAGGDLRVAGSWSRPVALRDPAEPSSYRRVISLSDAAIATSATYFSRRLCAGVEVSALVDGHARTPSTEAGSISVIASRCMLADALTKVVLFAIPERRNALLQDYGAEFLHLEA
jgi:FAD:protein FMN transferase